MKGRCSVVDWIRGMVVVCELNADSLDEVEVSLEAFKII